MTKKRALIVCPGRGSYNRESLGYFRRYQGFPREEEAREIIDAVDSSRLAQGRTLVSTLDSASSFSPETYLRGENAAALTFAASVADFVAIREAVRPVAVVGNSMGWYTALYLAGALSLSSAISLVDEMGNLQSLGSGSQLIYPVVREDWRPDPERLLLVERALAEARERGFAAYWSIRLGGYAVLGGEERALDFLCEVLPELPGGRGAPSYPLRLPHHAAFHTPLMVPVARAARELFRSLPVRAPEIPLVDGRGFIFRPLWAEPRAILDYTVGVQVTETYDFSLSLAVALKEFAPEVLVLLGPGETLGGVVAQILISEGFWGLSQKKDFIERQAKDPVVLACARPSIFRELALKL